MHTVKNFCNLFNFTNINLLVFAHLCRSAKSSV